MKILPLILVAVATPKDGVVNEGETKGAYPIKEAVSLNLVEIEVVSTVAVTAALPLKEVPVNPLPRVKVFVVVPPDALIVPLEIVTLVPAVKTEPSAAKICELVPPDLISEFAVIELLPRFKFVVAPEYGT